MKKDKKDKKKLTEKEIKKLRDLKQKQFDENKLIKKEYNGDI